MAKFTAENQPQNRGRKKGTKNRRMAISESLEKTTLEKLSEALDASEPWAIQAVLDRVAPKLKAVTPEHSLDGALLQLRILEIRELEERLKALEARLVN
jgi:hypothetical protein